MLVISVVPGNQPSLNNEEKPEKGERGRRGLLTPTTLGVLVWKINTREENKLQCGAHYWKGALYFGLICAQIWDGRREGDMDSEAEC